MALGLAAVAVAGLALWLYGVWWELPVGTRSVLAGVHAFWLHPWFVAAGWWRLYGFPLDPRLWAAFAVHDLGYWARPNMDGPEGEEHPALGARLMAAWFDGPPDPGRDVILSVEGEPRAWLGQWGRLVLCHSRFLAEREGLPPSRLCHADKLAIVLTPWWLYLPLARISGELGEYMDPGHHQGGGKYEDEGHRFDGTPREWYESVQDYLRGWVEDNA